MQRCWGGTECQFDAGCSEEDAEGAFEEGVGLGVQVGVWTVMLGVSVERDREVVEEGGL